MSQQGATLQGLNNELVSCIEQLKRKRETVQDLIEQEEAEKEKLQSDLHILSERLARLTESISKKMQAREQYDRTIKDSEQAYNKILESSETLLQVLKYNSDHQP
eukprot:m.9391 g.9391  ORF g.9391 m.9391 type:complete len:105 (-) comp4057_c0_seq1:41-355(-)